MGQETGHAPGCLAAAPHQAVVKVLSGATGSRLDPLGENWLPSSLRLLAGVIDFLLQG